MRTETVGGGVEDLVAVLKDKVRGRHGDVGCRRSLIGCSLAITKVKEKSGKERWFVADDGENCWRMLKVEEI